MEFQLCKSITKYQSNILQFIDINYIHRSSINFTIRKLFLVWTNHNVILVVANYFTYLLILGYWLMYYPNVIYTDCLLKWHNLQNPICFNLVPELRVYYCIHFSYPLFVYCKVFFALHILYTLFTTEHKWKIYLQLINKNPVPFLGLVK